eukprot:216838_1
MIGYRMQLIQQELTDIQYYIFIHFAIKKLRLIFVITCYILYTHHHYTLWLKYSCKKYSNKQGIWIKHITHMLDTMVFLYLDVNIGACYAYSIRIVVIGKSDGINACTLYNNGVTLSIGLLCIYDYDHLHQKSA